MTPKKAKDKLDRHEDRHYVYVDYTTNSKKQHFEVLLEEYKKTL